VNFRIATNWRIREPDRPFENSLIQDLAVMWDDPKRPIMLDRPLIPTRQQEDSSDECERPGPGRAGERATSGFDAPDWWIYRGTGRPIHDIDLPAILPPAATLALLFRDSARAEHGQRSPLPPLAVAGHRQPGHTLVPPPPRR
jgi:hypothetical protein